MKYSGQKLGQVYGGSRTSTTEDGNCWGWSLRRQREYGQQRNRMHAKTALGARRRRSAESIAAPSPRSCWFPATGGGTAMRTRRFGRRNSGDRALAGDRCRRRRAPCCGW